LSDLILAVKTLNFLERKAILGKVEGRIAKIIKRELGGVKLKT
jgi:hypothetical protein